jgi:hypothetical protein
MSLAETVNTDYDWISFPGGELEGKRPKALCGPCRQKLQSAVFGSRAAVRTRKTLCFQCYRAELERDRAIRDAGDLNTTSNERFQFQLPLEPLDRPRLTRLKIDRAHDRASLPPAVNRRRHAQIEARHALQEIAAGLAARGLAQSDRQHAIFEAVHAAELQLPDAWLPFVVSR